MKPQICRSLGVKLQPDKEHITIYTVNNFLQHNVSNLKDNGRIALSVGDPLTFETFQFKGIFSKIEPCSLEDKILIKEFTDAFLGILVQWYGEGAGEGFKKINIDNCEAVTFKVEEIFNQTPKPGAGFKIS